MDDIKRYAVEKYEVISFSTAEPGWRALFEPKKGSNSYRVEPLIGWGVYELTITDAETGEAFKKRRRVLGGVCMNGISTPVCVLEYGLAFAGYLRPGEPDPGSKTPGE